VKRGRASLCAARYRLVNEPIQMSPATTTAATSIRSPMSPLLGLRPISTTRYRAPIPMSRTTTPTPTIHRRELGGFKRLGSFILTMDEMFSPASRLGKYQSLPRPYSTIFRFLLNKRCLYEAAQRLIRSNSNGSGEIEGSHVIEQDWNPKTPVMILSDQIRGQTLRFASKNEKVAG